MKLNSKTNRYFLFASLVVFAVGGILFYFLFQWIIDRDFNKRLHERKEYYIDIFSRSDSVAHYQQFSANSIGIIPIHPFTDSVEVVSDTVIFDEIEGKPNRYRQVALNKRVRGRDFRIEVRRALVERKDVIQGVVVLEMLLFLAFVVTLTWLNNQLSRSLWRPFYDILDRINNYKADHAEAMHFNRTSITEFNELAIAIEKMTGKIHTEFHILKEFTENASHEIQTPLAIVKGKLEVLLQSPHLTEEQMDLINAASLAANRLSKLNEALLILSRIENRQFHVVEDIRLQDQFNRHLADLDELIRMKGITIERRFSAPLVIKMNPYLADILLENLMVNAIKYNLPAGTIMITISANELIISNTGDRPSRDPVQFFQRFVKSNHKSPSLGLGLSIVKAICDTYHLPVQYWFENGNHIISIRFAG